MKAIEKPVERETAVTYRGRLLVLTLHSRYLEISEKGRRDSLSVDYAALFEFACKLRFLSERKESA
jgi:hypothetical protein